MHTGIYKIILVLVLLAGLQACTSQKRGNPVKLTIEISPADLIRSVAIAPYDSALNRALTDAQQKAGNQQIPAFIDVFAATYQEENPGLTLAHLFVPAGDEAASLDNNAIATLIKQRADLTIAQAYKVLKLRLKAMATDTLIANLDAKRGVIKAQLYSIDSFERIREVVAVQGKLEMFEAYDNSELLPMLIRANDNLAAPQSDAAGEEKPVAETTKDGKSDKASMDEYLSEDARAKEADDTRRKNPLFSLLMPSVTQEGKVLQGSVVGYALPKDTASLGKLLSARKTDFSWNIRFLYGMPEGNSTANRALPVYAVRIPVNGVASITGLDLVRVRADHDAINGKPCVTMEMTPDGTLRWSQMTLHQRGSYIAMVYDDQVVSAPRVNEQITSGNTEISGGFTERAAANIAIILAAGRLPVKVTVTEDHIAQ